MPSPQPSPTRPAPFTHRAVMLLFIAAALGGLVGFLTFMATPVLATAFIAGITFGCAALLGAHQLLE